MSTRRKPVAPGFAPFAIALVLLATVGGAIPLAAQDAIFPAEKPPSETPGQMALPDPAQLEPGWWQAIVSDTEDLDSQIDAIVGTAAERVAQLPELRQAEAQEALARLKSNLRGYLRLRSRPADEPPPASTYQEEYSLDAIIDLDRSLRRARVRVDGDVAELESRERSIASQEKQADSRFAAYLTTPERSAERLLAGLNVMALRAGLLLEQQQVRLLSARVETVRSSVSQLDEELAVARERLSLEKMSLEALERDLKKANRDLDVARRQLRQTEAELIDVVADAEPDSGTVALARQQVTLRGIREAKAELALAALEARNDLVLLRDDTGEEVVANVRQRSLQRQDIVDRVQSRLQGWTESGEQGLSESASAITEDGQRKTLEQRAVVAGSVLSELQTTKQSLGDLRLLRQIVSASLVQREGRVKATLSDLGEQISGAWSTLKKIATASIVSIGDTPITLAGLLRVLLILTAAFWVSRILRHALDRMGASRRTSMSQSSLYSLGRLLHYVIIIAGIVIGLSSIGLDFTNLALVASALGVGIGFGLQSVVSNFVSGLILLFERSLNVGDFVELDSGVTGVIKEINVRSTLLNTNDNVDILVPNSEFVNGKLINWTLREAVKRVHISFGVAYGTDKDLTKKAVLEAADRVPLTLKGPGREPQVWLVNFGDSSLDYELVVWLGADAVRRPAAVQAAYLWEIETSLGAHGIEIPFPQRDLHLRSGMEVLRPRGSE